MLRYQVAYKFIKFKGKTYQAGDLLPETFTDKDKFRNIYSSRIVQVEVADQDKDEDPKTDPPGEPTKELTQPVNPPLQVKNDNTSSIETPKVPAMGLNSGIQNNPPAGIKPITPLVRTPLSQGAQPKA